jgi:hypothetical protein
VTVLSLSVLALITMLGACGGPPAKTAELGNAFSCVDKTCDARSSYCEKQAGDVRLPNGALQETGACRALPNACRGVTACSCFPKDTPCAQFGGCEAVPAGATTGLVIGCPSGPTL